MLGVRLSLPLPLLCRTPLFLSTKLPLSTHGPAAVRIVLYTNHNVGDFLPDTGLLLEPQSRFGDELLML